jgi:RHS repeat-associated protein
MKTIFSRQMKRSRVRRCMQMVLPAGLLAVFLVIVVLLTAVRVAAEDVKPDLPNQPLTQETGGYWQRVEKPIADPVSEERITVDGLGTPDKKHAYAEEVRYGALCGTATNTLSDGSFVYQRKYFKREHCYKSDHYFTAVATWSQPPERIIPGKPLTLQANLSMATSITSSTSSWYYEGTSLSISTDEPDVGCGYKSGGGKDVCSMRVSAPTPEGHVETKEDCVLEVGAGRSAGDQLALRYCTHAGGYRYVYEWVPAEEKPADLGPGTVEDPNPEQPKPDPPKADDSEPDMGYQGPPSSDSSSGGSVLGPLAVLGTLGTLGVLGVVGVVGAAVAAILVAVLKGGAAAGGAAATAAGPAVGSASGKDAAPTATKSANTLQSGTAAANTGSMSAPGLQGGPEDNPHTAFEEGRGPGDCTNMGLPNFWINTTILNLVVKDTLYRWDGLGPLVDLTLTYNSGCAAERSLFGWGWSFMYDQSLNCSGSVVTLFKSSGQKDVFAFPEAMAESKLPIDLVSSNGSHHRLSYHGDHWQYVEQDSRLMYRFGPVPETEIALLSQVSDNYGNALKIGFDEYGRIGSIADAVGRCVTFQFNNHNLCNSFVLPDGRTASFKYDTDGNLIQVIDLHGVTSDYEYDDERCLTRMVVGGQKKTTIFEYSDSGENKHLAAVTDAEGHITWYDMNYDERVQVKVTDPGGEITEFLSRDGLTEKITDPLGFYREYIYRNGLQIAYRDKNGNLTQREFDDLGNLISLVDPGGNTTKCQYDQQSNLMEITNSLGEIWCFAYDEQSRLIKTISPLGTATNREYNSLGQLAAIKDPDGYRTNFQYDRFGNLKVLVNPMGEHTTYDYDQWGLRLVAITDPLNRTTTFEYDNNDRMVGVLNPDGTTRSYFYDCCVSYLTKDENGNSARFERDALLNVTRAFDRLGNATNYGYDENNNLAEFIEVGGQKTIMAYDAGGRLVSVIDALGNETKLNYDPEGNLVALEDPNNRKMWFQSNPSDLSNSVIDCLGNTVTLQQDGAGRVSLITNARGNRISFAYDPGGRVKAIGYDGVQVAAYRQDARGNLLEMRDASGTTAYAYNAINQPISIKYPNGMRVTSEYDAAGNLTNCGYPGGVQVNYRYNSRNLITEIRWGDNHMNFSYDAAGILLIEKRSNGTKSCYEINKNSWLMGIKHLQKGTPFFDVSYVRDGVGNIVQETGLYPLASVPPETQVRPDIGEFNELNQLVNFNNRRCHYDSDGNLIEIEGGLWQASYDPQNRLVELIRNDHTTEYRYDGLGHRYESQAGVATNKYYYDQAGKLMFEIGPTGETKSYIYRERVLMASVKENGKTTFYHYDKIGSTVALSDQKGEVVAVYSYTPFGETVGQGDDSGNPFTYVGAYGVMNEEAGLYHMQHRYYNAQMGRFVQKDPAGIQGGINPYAYAENNPLFYIDPTGTMPLVITLGGLLAVGGVLLTGYTIGAAGHNVIKTGQKIEEVGYLKSEQVRLESELFDYYIIDPGRKLVAKKYGKYEGMSATERLAEEMRVRKLARRWVEVKVKLWESNAEVWDRASTAALDAVVVPAETVIVPVKYVVPYTVAKEAVKRCIKPK